MSRVVKVYLKDKDYNRILEEHGNVADYIYSLLGYEKTERNADLEKYVIDKIRSYEIGTEFSFRDVFDNDPDQLTTSNAKLVRYVCKHHDFAECAAYDSINRVRIYRRIVEEADNGRDPRSTE